MICLRLRGAERTYNDGHPVHALRPTDLDINERDFVTITGASGSGKSTLLNVLGLLDRPTAGSYEIGGVNMAAAGEKVRGAVRGQKFGFVFQSYHLVLRRTALENVELGMLYGPHKARERRQIAAEALERIGLAHRSHADPRQMSGGERQRVAIARAIATKPSVLFCDEPTGNLDSRNTGKVLDLLRELHQGGLTVVVVTHDLHVASVGTRQLSVTDGRVREEQR
ncbi:ABC transporter ATP-binding protein [Micromonospora sp. URMC 107]|uniref:ABC transporter ATP-binding protein n=1 Tax=Micromonospora sp. URMC 107 TaxID=3423418 RepID=UPI003F1DD660